MKKLLIITALLLFTGIAFGQTLQKGNVLGIHVYKTFELQPDVTMEQFQDFLINKYVPEYEKHFPGAKLFFMKGDKGVDNNKFGMIFYFDDIETRDKYIKIEGGFTEAGNEAWEKVKPVFDELLKLMGDNEREFTDWVIL